jgi:hypothetical protein
MDISPIKPFLSGEQFSDSLEVDCSHENATLASRGDGRWAENRLKMIVDMTKGKTVLHVGFTDHLPLIETKIAQDRWLHKLLVDSCSKCVGIDVNAAAVEFVRSELGFTDVHVCDLLVDDLSPVLGDTKFDFLVLGEVLEHTDDPVSFLSTLRVRLAAHIDKCLITVPNGFSFANVQNIWRSKEFINSDHRYWFTPYTLAKVVSRAGMRIERVGFCGPPFHRNPLVRFALRGRQLFSDTLFAVVSLNE